MTPVNCASHGCTAPVVALIVLRAANKARRGVYALPTCEGHAEAAEVYLWRDDVGAAMSLLNDFSNWKIEKDTGETVSGDISTNYSVTIGRHGATNDSLTHAICDAWLAWKEGQG